MKKAFIFYTLFFLVHFSKAQQATSSAEILQNLLKLKTLGSVLYVAAHPDDENTRLLSYLAKERKYRTGYLSITRGDGGQNLIGKEQGEMLGLIRTQELLAARKIDGAEQFFTRANDFGYSKNPEETFSIWNRDSILADMVWVIRKFRPDVIVCRFPTTGEGGHGHHTASAILAEEAFDAAADPKKFPNQLNHVSVWQTKRLFWNTFNFGGTNTTSPDQLKIDVGVYNKLLGKGYGEIAADSRSMHKSQGFGSAKTRGETLEYFKQLKGETVKNDLFEGINTSWLRLGANIDFKKVDVALQAIIDQYNFQHPEKSVSALIDLYKIIYKIRTNDLIDYWKTLKLQELEDIIMQCAGIFAEATTTTQTIVQTEPVQINTQFVSRSLPGVILKKIMYYQHTDSLMDLTTNLNQLYSYKHKETVPDIVTNRGPYWLERDHSIGLFDVKHLELIGRPENKTVVAATFEVSIEGQSFYLERKLQYKYTDPIKGEIYRDVECLPPFVVNPASDLLVFNTNEPKTVSFLVKAYTNANGTLTAAPNTAWKVEFKNPAFDLKKGEETTITATITPAKNPENSSLTIVAQRSEKETMPTKRMERVEYDHIPHQFILSNTKIKLIYLDVKTSKGKIGYIPGAGDEVMQCLQQIGFNITELNDEKLTHEDLSQYSAIITGVRAYNTDQRLQVHYDKLMLYVKNGGNLIVQYNTNSRVGPVPPKIGPHPFTISRERVTDENAEMKFLKPDHVILNSPNKITSEDFKNWVQERGIYFATEIKENYETLLATYDPNEKNADGSLIYCKYGKGNFVYTGLAFFRQLPAGVPGAYRLFANLIALPVSK